MDHKKSHRHHQAIIQHQFTISNKTALQPTSTISNTTATQDNTLQPTATISNTTATNTTHCNNPQQSEPQRIAVHCSALQCVAGVCGALASLPAFSFFLSHLIKALGIVHSSRYGVATISRLLKITSLFCRISSLL